MAPSISTKISRRTAVFERFALSEASDRSRFAAWVTSIQVHLRKSSPSISPEKSTLLQSFLLPLKPFIAVLSEGTVGGWTVTAKFVGFLLKWSERYDENGPDD